MTRVLHVITGLEVGGAETMLAKLIGSRQPGIEHLLVISLTGLGPIATRIQEHGVAVKALGLRNIVDVCARGIRNLRSLIRYHKPDVVHSQMYHSNIIAGTVARACSDSGVLWSVHHTNFDKSTKVLTRVTGLACSLAAESIPDRILFVSEESRRVHVRAGYPAARSQVIPNGFELKKFFPDAEKRVAVRERLQIPRDAIVFGYVGRNNPQKAPEVFLSSGLSLLQKYKSAYLVMCGAGIDRNNKNLVSQLSADLPQSRIQLLGPRSDIPDLLNAFDILVNSSVSEAFPNIIGEAMATGLPCVVTDVGDCRSMVGATGRVVSPGSCPELIKACCELVDAGSSYRSRLGEAARRLIENSYSIEAVGRRYVSLYESISNAR